MRDRLDKILPAIVWTIAVLVATWAAWVIVTSRENMPPPLETTESAGMREIPPIIADRPILEEVSTDGLVKWTLYLEKIVREEGSVTELAKPRALYKFKSGETLEVTGDSGTYDEQTGMLRLTGNVRGHARGAEFSFLVDNMTWNNETSVLEALGNVEIVRGGIDFKGRDLRLDLSQELARIEVGGGVEITSAPGSLEDLGLNPSG